MNDYSHFADSWICAKCGRSNAWWVSTCSCGGSIVLKVGNATQFRVENMLAANPIMLLDLSHWQGSSIDWRKMKEAGIAGVYIKLTQGELHKDILAAQHYANAQMVGILTGGYHFTTNDPAGLQVDNYLQTKAAIGDKWTLPDWQDCEAYTSYQGETMSVYELKEYVLKPDPFAILSENEDLLTIARKHYTLAPDEDFGSKVEICEVFYPSYTIVDSIGRQLNKIAKSAIYTNPASGNRIFGNRTIFGERYYLSLAHWYVSKPTPPVAWKGKDLLNWQRGVVDGKQYGIPGQVDYNEWQTAMPWPANPVPPPPQSESVVRFTMNDGSIRTFKEV